MYVKYAAYEGVVSDTPRCSRVRHDTPEGPSQSIETPGVRVSFFGSRSVFVSSTCLGTTVKSDETAEDAAPRPVVPSKGVRSTGGMSHAEW